MGVIVSTAVSSEVAGTQGNKVTPRVVEWNTLASSIEATALSEPSVIPFMSSPGPRLFKVKLFHQLLYPNRKRFLYPVSREKQPLPALA